MLHTKFVSLGNDCQAAYQTRRLSSIRCKSFFDWLVTPTESITRLIDNEFDGLLNRWEWRNGTAHPILIDLDYGLSFEHGINEASDNEAARIRSEFMQKGRDFLDLLNARDPVCFVMRFSKGIWETEAAKAKRIGADILERRCNSVFVLAREGATGEISHNGRMIDVCNPNEAFNPDGSVRWQGDDTLWERHLYLAARQCDVHAAPSDMTRVLTAPPPVSAPR